MYISKYTYIALTLSKQDEKEKTKTKKVFLTQFLCIHRKRKKTNKRKETV